MALMLAPYNDAMRLGMGFNSYTQAMCTDGAVKVSKDESKSAYVHSTNPAQTVSYSSRIVDKLSDIVDTMSISYGSAIKKGTVDVNGSSSTINEDKIKSSDLNAVVSVKVQNQTQLISENAQFQELPGVVAGSPRFNEIYGDSYISGFIEGGDFTGVISVHVLDRQMVDSVSEQFKKSLSSGKDKEFVLEEIHPYDVASDAARALKETETTVSVSWKGGGQIKDESVQWDLSSLFIAAASFPARVAESPQRTWAILTKYTANRSYVQWARTSAFSPLQYELVFGYTTELFENFFQYKQLVKKVQSIITDMSKYDAQPPAKVRAIPLELNTLVAVKSALRGEMSKIVEAIDVLTRDPWILKRIKHQQAEPTNPLVKEILLAARYGDTTSVVTRQQMQVLVSPAVVTASAQRLEPSSTGAEDSTANLQDVNDIQDVANAQPASDSGSKSSKQGDDGFIAIEEKDMPDSSSSGSVTKDVPKITPPEELTFDFASLVAPEIWSDLLPLAKVEREIGIAGGTRSGYPFSVYGIPPPPTAEEEAALAMGTNKELAGLKKANDENKVEFGLLDTKYNEALKSIEKLEAKLEESQSETKKAKEANATVKAMPSALDPKKNESFYHGPQNLPELIRQSLQKYETKQEFFYVTPLCGRRDQGLKGSKVFNFLDKIDKDWVIQDIWVYVSGTDKDGYARGIYGITVKYTNGTEVKAGTENGQTYSTSAAWHAATQGYPDFVNESLKVDWPPRRCFNGVYFRSAKAPATGVQATVANTEIPVFMRIFSNQCEAMEAKVRNWANTDQIVGNVQLSPEWSLKGFYGSVEEKSQLIESVGCIWGRDDNVASTPSQPAKTAQPTVNQPAPAPTPAAPTTSAASATSAVPTTSAAPTTSTALTPNASLYDPDLMSGYIIDPKIKAAVEKYEVRKNVYYLSRYSGNHYPAQTTFNFLDNIERNWRIHAIWVTLVTNAQGGYAGIHGMTVNYTNGFMVKVGYKVEDQWNHFDSNRLDSIKLDNGTNSEASISQVSFHASKNNPWKVEYPMGMRVNTDYGVQKDMKAIEFEASDVVVSHKQRTAGWTLRGFYGAYHETLGIITHIGCIWGQ